MSAVRIPNHPKPHPGPDAGRPLPEDETAESRIREPEALSPDSAESPARKLQSELARRLWKPRRFTVRTVIAVLLVLCLSMTIANFFLITLA